MLQEKSKLFRDHSDVILLGQSRFTFVQCRYSFCLVIDVFLRTQTSFVQVIIMLRIFCCRPTQEMVKHVISRQFGDVDRFATSLLRHWALVHMEKLTEHLTALLINSKSRNTPPRKGLRQR